MTHVERCASTTDFAVLAPEPRTITVACDRAADHRGMHIADNPFNEGDLIRWGS